MDYWGYELLVACDGADVDKITSRDNVAAFTKELVERIDMKAYGDPWIEHFATHDPSKGGFTLFQAIETSAITAHFVDATGEIYLNVHSCKDFDGDVVEDVVTKYFNPKRTTSTMILRGRGGQDVSYSTEWSEN